MEGTEEDLEEALAQHEAVERMAVRECLAAAVDVRGVYIGVKLLAAGAVADSVESRLGANAQLLGLIREADGR